MSEEDKNVILDHVVRKFSSGNDLIHAVDKISLKITKGEFVIIMGPSGSGKTTLLNLISGLSSLSSGSITINGKPLHGLTETEKALLRRSEIGIIFQFYNLHEGLTALENVELPMLIAGVPLKERRKKSKSLLTDVGLENRFYHRPYELSGGEKQRVGIARALSNNATILLADEPTGDLDEETGKKVLSLLQDLNKNKNITIIMVTHDSSLIQKDFRLIRLTDGKIASDEVILDPESVVDDFSPLVNK